MRQPASQDENQSDDSQQARVRQLRRRNRLVMGAGVLCFLLGVPLVSLPDGTALSVIGLSLVAVAGVCLISLVFLLAGEGEEDEYERHPKA